MHLPFCKRRCYYCDFPIQVVGGKAPDAALDGMREYVAHLGREVRCLDVEATSPLETLYFGGGTPSLIPPELLEELLQALERQFGLATGAEVTLEADPGTFDAARLRQYLDLGVTRFSMGVQAFQDEVLERCGRAHTAYDALKAIEAVHAVGPPSWTLDLMGGLPGQTPEQWRASLEAALDAGAPHLSV